MPSLREARRAKFMTIRELAQQAQTATRTIVEIEAGRITPRFATIKKLAAALGLAPGEITEFAAARDADAREGQP